MIKNNLVAEQNEVAKTKDNSKKQNFGTNAKLFPIICPQSSYLTEHSKALVATGTQGPES